MKIVRDEPKFNPIHITIESKDELETLVSILNPKNLKWSVAENLFAQTLRKTLGDA